MTVEGVDFSYDPPSPPQLVKAGKKFAVRYGGVGNTGKFLTAAEAAELKAAGLGIVANVEETAKAFRGQAAGVRHAAAGDSFFRARGMPADRPIYFSVDWDAGPADWPAIDAALRGAAAVLGVERVGVYGGYATIAHCASTGLASWLWQTYAWSGGRWHPRCHLQQYKNNVTLADGTVDLDRGMTADFGQWGGMTVATSQNGWPVDTSGSLQDKADIYPGIAVPNGIRKGDVAVVLRHLAKRFHTEVEPLRAGWCWGWYVKVIEGGSATSNHASGTAVDLNAPDHPMGSVDTFSATKQAAIRRILTDLGGVIRWGGDYSGRHDDMHFEINRDATAVKALADRIRAGTTTGGDDMAEGLEMDKTPIKYPAASTTNPNWTGWNALGDARDRAAEAVDRVKAVQNDMAAVKTQVASLSAAVVRLAGTDQVDEAAIVQGVLSGVNLNAAAIADAVVNAMPTEEAERLVDALLDRVRRGTATP